MKSTISTPRLTLIRMTDTSEDSEHLQWFHRFWNDDSMTVWSLHGKTHTLAASREWMIKTNTENQSLNYAVFAKTQSSRGTETDLGELVGNASLWNAASGASIMPPRVFPTEPTDGEKSSSTAEGDDARLLKEVEKDDQPLNVKLVAYSLFQPFYGNGYATEAARALIDEFTSSVAQESEKGEQRFYIEAGVDKDNPASQRVLGRLGFSRVGWKEEEGKVFLNGEWREGGYWVYGRYVF